MRTTADHAADPPGDWKAPGAALVRGAATGRVPALAELGRVHTMGIAGSRMSELARLLFNHGLPVRGCEARESITVAGLQALGVSGNGPRCRHRSFGFCNAQPGDRRPDCRRGFLGSRLLGLLHSVIIANTVGTRLWKAWPELLHDAAGSD